MHNEPLAFRMRPRNLDEVVGQQHIVGKDTVLYKMVQNGYVPSMLLYGEPGTGKTSIAYAIAGSTKLPFFHSTRQLPEKRMSNKLYQKQGSVEKSYYF